jgi:hypothetical protein
MTVNAHSPTASDSHVNRPLTNMSVAFMQSLSKFKADLLAPIMPVQKKSDVYFKILKEYWFSDLMRKRGVGARAIQAGYGIAQDSYLCDLWAVGKPIDDQTRANEDTPLNSDRTAMKFITRLERMNREKSFKDAFWSTGKWTTDLTGNSSASNITGANTFRQWSHDSATPIDDIEEMKTVMEKLTGFTPNVLALGKPAWTKLKRCPQILERITGGATSINPAKVTLQMVAGLFELEEIVILDAVENTAGHGNAMVGDYIFGDDGLLMFRDADIAIESATAMRTITWQQYAGNANGTRILKWRDEPIHSDQVEIESTYAHKIIAPDLGIFLDDITA